MKDSDVEKKGEKKTWYNILSTKDGRKSMQNLEIRNKG